MGVDSILDVPRAFKQYTLAGVADLISAPALILDADNDQFFKGEPRRAAEAMINSETTLVTLREDEGAGEHCHWERCRGCIKSSSTGWPRPSPTTSQPPKTTPTQPLRSTSR